MNKYLITLNSNHSTEQKKQKPKSARHKFNLDLFDHGNDRVEP